MNEPLVSISMLTYNHELYIAQAIESVLKQKTTFPFQLVISEDCSTDRTREICIIYKKMFPDKVKLILQDSNKGAVYNAVENLKNCTGKYTAVCEGDDFWTDEFKLQAQVELMEKNPKYPMCFTNSIIVDSAGNVIKDSRVPDDKKRNIVQKEIIEGFCPPTNTILFKSELLRTLPAEYAQVANGDFFLSIYFTEYGEAAYIDRNTAVYRIHPNSGWSTKPEIYQTFHYLNTCKVLLKLYGNKYGTYLQKQINYASARLTELEKKSKLTNKDYSIPQSEKIQKTENIFQKKIESEIRMNGIKNIVISGTNFWNPGDDFVRDGVIRVLKNLFPDTQLNFLFYNFNQDFFPQNKFSGVHNMASAGDLNQYKAFIDAVVIAGLSAGNEIKDLYNWVIENGLTDRVYLIGAGYENSYVDRFIKEEPELTIFKNAKVITGRTYKRPKLIDELNLPYHHINCPAILSVEDVKDIPENKKIERIGFSIQLPHEIGVLNHACTSSMYQTSIEILSELFGKYEIEVIAHHKSEYFHFLNLFKQYNVQVKVIFSSFYQDLFKIYPRYDLFITTRLHSSLFANGFGIPGIIINDTDRHTHCLQGFQHSHWVNTKEKFNEVFTQINNNSLNRIAGELKEFKSNLLAKYLDILSEPFGISKNTKINKPVDVSKKDDKKLPVNFFTIVLNGKPFIEYHINAFKNLPFDWHWHIIEGVADLKNDTAWSLENGGTVSELLHRNGLSNDGTTEYLDELKKLYPDNITVYRKGSGQFWDGKLEMVNEPLKNIKDECLLWQVDSDELWTAQQIIDTRKLFIEDPGKTAAYFYCRYFVGENLYISTKDTYGNHVDYEWLRVWNYKPGDKWLTHEPPALCRNTGNDTWTDLSRINPLKQEKTNSKNLVFQHYSYATENQLRFKEIYYGYTGAVSRWKALNNQRFYPVCLKDFFSWVQDGSVVETINEKEFKPIAKNVNGKWFFNYEFAENPADSLFKSDYNYTLEAEAAINNNNLETAKILLKCALNISAKNINAINDLAVIEIMEKHYDSAMKILNDIIKFDGNNETAKNNKLVLEGLMKISA